MNNGGQRKWQTITLAIKKYAQLAHTGPVKETLTVLGHGSKTVETKADAQLTPILLKPLLQTHALALIGRNGLL